MNIREARVAKTNTRKKYRINIPSTFETSVNQLSYAQLIRTIMLINAQNTAERNEALRITRSILPKERTIINEINRCKSQIQKNAKIRYIQKALAKKNSIETKDIDTDALIKSLLTVKE